MLAAAGGLLVISSLVIFITELPHKHRRVSGLLLSLAFEALGVVALVLWRRRPAVAVGVVVSAIAVLAVLVFAFVDPNRPSVAFKTLGRSKGTLTEILAVSAAVWLVTYLVGPGRRFAFYLGAALTALWLVLLVQIVSSVIGSSGRRFPATADSGSGVLGPTIDDSSLSPSPSSALTRIGLVSLGVGLVYLVLAWRLDHRGGTRPATPFFAVAAVTLTVAVLTLTSPWKVQGASILAMALGACLIWLGATTGRRFTGWYGGFATFAGTLALLIKLSRHNNKVAGALALVVGLGLAILANWFTGRAEPGDREPTHMTPLPLWTPPEGPPSSTG